MERWRAGLGLIASLGFCGLGVVIAVMDRTALTAATAILLFFGACGAVFLGELLARPRSAPRVGDEPILLTPPRGRFLAPLVGALGFAASLPFLWRMGLGESLWGSTLVAFGGALSLLAAGALLIRLSRPRALYGFDQDGVAGPGWRIPWAQIDGFTAYHIHGQPFLGLRTRPDAAGTLATTANEALGFPGYSIPASATGLALNDLEALAAACQAQWALRGRDARSPRRGPHRPPE